MGKAEKPAKKTGETSGNHSNQKVAKETTKTKADDTPVITADNANTVKSEPLKPNGDVTSDSNKNTCQNNSEDTADKTGKILYISFVIVKFILLIYLKFNFNFIRNRVPSENVKSTCVLKI